jgi:hypothetical protein
LDRDEDEDGDDRPSEKKKKELPGNQDLWLLNLFFKGCSVVV